MSYQQRTADWCVQKASLHGQGKPAALATTSTKYQLLLGIADSMQKLWASEPDTEWNSLYSNVASGTITATDTFDLDDSINYVSERETDYITIVNGTKTKTYTRVSPNQLYQYRNSRVVAQVGRQLKFAKAFDSTSSVFGGTIMVPAVTFADDIDSPNDLVQVDDPMWLVYMMAAEFVRNKVTKQAQYNTLLNLATSTMDKMKDANNGNYDEVVGGWVPAGQSWV